MTISERIFYLLEKQGKKQSDLVKTLNVRPNTVSEWRSKNRTPDTTYLEKIADFFGVTIDYLVTGKESAAVIKQGIFGDRNQNNTVNFGVVDMVHITEFEGELIRVCGLLDIRRKTALLTYAYSLEKEMSEVQ